jgi:hypothetical protein
LSYKLDERAKFKFNKAAINGTSKASNKTYWHCIEENPEAKQAQPLSE